MRKWLQDLRSEERLQNGYVLILPGVEGRSIFNGYVARGLAAAGVPYAIEIDDWTNHLLFYPTFIYNLRSRRLHQQQAERMAAKIVDYQRKYPHRPVYLIGHSGGGAMSVMTLECLPEGSTVSGIVLLGAALSPGYSLRSALRHVDRKIWSFSSWGDCFFLGIFTFLCGTVDGCHSPSAGMVGFRCDELAREEREKFQELSFRFEYFRNGNLGGHFGCTCPIFIRKQVAPLLLACPTSAEALADHVNARLSNVPAT